MEVGNLKQTFKEIISKEDSIEKAYSKYAKLVDETVNQKVLGDASHRVTWTDQHGIRGRLDRITRSLIFFLRGAGGWRKESYNFETFHSLDENGVEALETANYRGSEIETLSGFMAGIFSWLFFLSLPMLPIIGVTFLLLTGISFIGFWGCIYSLSGARNRNLPTAFQGISAGYWAIASIKAVESKIE